jgi:TRAP transporter TAXI family solute receptor
VARRGAGIRTVNDLRGRSVSLGFRGSEAERAATAVLSAFGIDMAAVQLKYVPSETAAGQLIDGSLDAMFLVSGYPAEAVRRGTNGGHSHLVPIDGPAAERLRARSGYYFATLIPAGAYPEQNTPVRTVGIRNLLVTRRDLDEQIGYELTKQFFVALPKLSALVSSLQQVDVHRASATSIPLHDGAARYYRERELFR